MRLVIQKVKNGEVLYKEKTHCKINEGHIFYIGIETIDTSKEITECTNWIIDFINKSKQEALLLSQFTLFGSFKGSNPSFYKAKNNVEAKDMFYGLVDEVKKRTTTNVESGIFRECLDIIYSSDDQHTIYMDFNDKSKF